MSRYNEQLDLYDYPGDEGDYYPNTNRKQLKRKKIMKITKKFYVGSRSMVDGTRNDWAHSTLVKAIEHAKSLAEEQDEDQIVVQIIRVVRRAKNPLIVEKV